MNEPRTFYDQLADFYHLIFEDWDRSIAYQADVLSSVLMPLVPQSALVLDVACGIGTQAIGLALRGLRVIGSDVSGRALARARREAALRDVQAAWAVADFRALPFRSGAADVAVACDNALPHLPSLREIKVALLELSRCVRPGGMVLITMREYILQPPGTRELRPYGERTWNGARYLAEQEWLWEDGSYRMTLRIRPLDPGGSGVEVHTTYHAVSVEAVLRVMRDIGLADVRRLDGVYYQPVLIGMAR
jgi:SAM-dependent methyltransferase